MAVKSVNEQIERRKTDLNRREIEFKSGPESTLRVNRTWLFTAGMFLAMLVLSWLNEILDLPHLLLNAPNTPINWRESSLESILIVVIAVITLSVLLRDLKLQRQAEKALGQSEEKFRTFADSTYDWEMWEGPNHAYIYISPSCERITGRTQAEFLKKPNLFKEILHPEDRDAFLTHQATHWNESETGHIDFRIIKPDGTECWISHNCQPVYSQNGTFLGRRISNRDISIRMGLISDLEKALAEVKVLSGFLPICVHCKRIRDDDGYWQKLEKYIEERSEAQFTHGLCLECAKHLYPELAEEE